MKIKSNIIPFGAVKVSDKHSDAVVYLYDSNNKPCAIAFHGKAKKPDWHHYFENIKARNCFIKDFFMERKMHLLSVRRNKLIRDNSHQSVEIGDIYVVIKDDKIVFYEVVSKSGKATLMLHEVKQRRTKIGVRPISGHYVSTYALRKRFSAGKIRISGDEIAKEWNGKTVKWITKYYANSHGFGRCTIIEATSLEEAKADIRQSFGETGEPYTVREATDEDIAWFEAMSGGINT